MIKAGIVGASGYVGENLLNILAKHKNVELGMATSGSLAGKKVSDKFQGIECGLEFSKPDTAEMNQMDVVFLAVPHGKAKPIAKKLKCKVIDLSADHRLTHTYGLPEAFKDEIAEAKLVANPGCYATACILASYPLKEEIDYAVFDGISGYSGGGKNPKYDFEENIIAYNIAKHYHLNEMQHVLNAELCFTPHVVNAFRGLMCTAHIKLKSEMSQAEVKEKFEEFYKGSFTCVCESAPATKQVLKTPNCLVGGFEVHGKNVTIVSALDNLMKGAASQAVENLNLLFGLNQKTGLELTT